MHYEKTACGGEYGLMCHDNRRYINHSNEKIDSSRTCLNYNLAAMVYGDDKRTEYQRFRDRLGQCSYRKQKNNVRMCEIVIHAPKNLPEQEEDKFFVVARRELIKQTGGPDNEIYSWIHKDEGGAHHLHYGFCPAIEVNGVLKLSAKRVMNRAKLDHLHDDMQKAIDKAFGNHEYLIVADDPADRAKGSVPMKVYKMLMQQIEDCKDDFANAVADNEFLKLQQAVEAQERLDRLNYLDEAIKQKQDALDNLNAQESQEIAKMNHLQQEQQQMRNELDQAIERFAKLQDTTSLDAYIEAVYDRAPAFMQEHFDSFKPKHMVYWEDNIKPIHDEAAFIVAELSDLINQLDSSVVDMAEIDDYELEL